MWTILILVFSVLYLIYLWYTWNYDYFIKRGIPAVKAKFPLGNTPNGLLSKRNVLYDFEDLYNQFRGKEPLVGYFEAQTPRYLVISPEVAKKVMINHFSNFHDNEFSLLFNKDIEPMIGRNPFVLRGQEWKEKRAQVTPAFTNNRLRACFPLIEEIITRLKKYITDEYKKDSKAPFELRDLSARYTTDVVSSCAFNADAQSFTKENPEIRAMGMKFVQALSSFGLTQFLLTSLFPGIQNLLGLRIMDKVSEEFFLSLMLQAIKLRDSSNIQRDDYLSFLIELRKKKSISDIEMAAHGITLFMDGFETSSIGIAHILYEIAGSKRVQDKLRDEINDAIFDENGKIIYDKMLENEYLNQVFYEALRLHQPLGIYNRECSEDINLDCGNEKVYKIEKGMGINIPIHCIHRDPEYYTNPNEFNPERFDIENGGLKAFKDRGVLAPFGNGPRICLGKRFAQIQVKAAIVEVVRNFELTINEKTQRPLKIEPNHMLNVKVGGLWINMKPLK